MSKQSANAMQRLSSDFRRELERVVRALEFRLACRFDPNSPRLIVVLIALVAIAMLFDGLRHYLGT